MQNGSAPQFKDDEDLQFHLMDDHGFSHSRPRKLTRSNRPNRKRTSSSRDVTFEWSEPCFSPPPRKRVREMTATMLFENEGDDSPLKISSHGTTSPEYIPEG